MLTIRDEGDIALLSGDALRAFVTARLADLRQDDICDPDTQGYVVVMEPGDSVAAVEAAVGAPLLRNPVTGLDYGHPAFQPVADYFARHACWYEAVVVPGDGDFGVVLVVPRHVGGIEPRLLALCAEYAVTAPAEV